jgi:hypothetical protein
MENANITYEQAKQMPELKIYGDPEGVNLDDSNPPDGKHLAIFVYKNDPEKFLLIDGNYSAIGSEPEISGYLAKKSCE